MTLPPIARTTDPATSHEAEASLTDRESLMARCLKAVTEHPGLIAEEVAKATGLDHWAVTKRLSDLLAVGKVTQGPPRKASIGRQQVSWHPAEVCETCVYLERQESASVQVGRHGSVSVDGMLADHKAKFPAGVRLATIPLA